MTSIIIMITMGIMKPIIIIMIMTMRHTSSNNSNVQRIRGIRERGGAPRNPVGRSELRRSESPFARSQCVLSTRFYPCPQPLSSEPTRLLSRRLPPSCDRGLSNHELPLSTGRASTEVNKYGRVSTPLRSTVPLSDFQEQQL